MCAPTPLCVTTCGVVSERLGSRYRSGRTHDWLKFKNPNAPVVKREHRQNDNGGDPDERLFAPHPSFHRHDTAFLRSLTGDRKPRANSAVAAGSIPTQNALWLQPLARGNGLQWARDQQKFAELLNVDRGRWNNVECGAPLSKEMALRIVRKFPGVTLDWLFLGRTEGLTAEMALACSSRDQREISTRVAIREQELPATTVRNRGRAG